MNGITGAMKPYTCIQQIEFVRRGGRRGTLFTELAQTCRARSLRGHSLGLSGRSIDAQDTLHIVPSIADAWELHRLHHAGDWTMTCHNARGAWIGRCRRCRTFRIGEAQPC